MVWGRTLRRTNAPYATTPANAMAAAAATAPSAIPAVAKPDRAPPPPLPLPLPPPPLAASLPGRAAVGSANTKLSTPAGVQAAYQQHSWHVAT